MTERTEPGRDDVVRLTAWVHGQVQGVGFRWWTRARALELGLAGHAANLADGRVEVVAEGPESSCRALLELLRAPGTPGRVRTVVERFDRPRGLPAGFQER
ncbi:MAG TPA: acylphosphatase [Nakamurella sp.]|nr:acylphosphatase [Nakamurella sp.]